MDSGVSTNAQASHRAAFNHVWGALVTAAERDAHERVFERLKWLMRACLYPLVEGDKEFEEEMSRIANLGQGEVPYQDGERTEGALTARVREEDAERRLRWLKRNEEFAAMVHAAFRRNLWGQEAIVLSRPKKGSLTPVRPPEDDAAEAEA